MKITFPCPGCGKALKSRGGEVGRRRKCPVCNTRVTCPEPAFQAQFIDEDAADADALAADLVDIIPEIPAAAAPRRAAAGRAAPPPPADPDPPFDPFADVDGDPYQLADPATTAAAAADGAQRPCRSCGETISESALECPHCGAALAPAPGKAARKAGRKKSSRGGSGMNPAAGRDLGIGILCVVVGIALTAWSFANPSVDGQGNGKFWVFHGLILGGLFQVGRGTIGLFR